MLSYCFYYCFVPNFAPDFPIFSAQEKKKLNKITIYNKRETIYRIKYEGERIERTLKYDWLNITTQLFAVFMESLFKGCGGRDEWMELKEFLDDCDWNWGQMRDFFWFSVQNSAVIRFSCTDLAKFPI